jgi:hypothetical protein
VAAEVIGGAPRCDTARAGQIERIFELAREFDVDIVAGMPPDADRPSRRALRADRV